MVNKPVILNKRYESAPVVQKSRTSFNIFSLGSLFVYSSAISVKSRKGGIDIPFKAVIVIQLIGNISAAHLKYIPLLVLFSLVLNSSKEVVDRNFYLSGRIMFIFKDVSDNKTVRGYTCDHRIVRIHLF